MKNKTLLALSIFSLLLCASANVHAQTTIGGSGCANSPEAPTDVLLLVGTVGMFYGSSMIAKLRRK